MSNNECNICMDRDVNTQLCCQTCSACICSTCCNSMKSVKYDEKYGVFAKYDCPYCRCKTETAFRELNRKDLFEFINFDYKKFIVIANKYDDLVDKYKNNVNEHHNKLSQTQEYLKKIEEQKRMNNIQKSYIDALEKKVKKMREVEKKTKLRETLSVLSSKNRKTIRIEEVKQLLLED